MQKSSAFLTIFSGHTLADFIGSALISLGGIAAVIFAVACISRAAAWAFIFGLKYLDVYRRCYIGWKFYALHKDWIERDPERSAWSTYTVRKNGGAE